MMISLVDLEAEEGYEVSLQAKFPQEFFQFGERFAYQDRGTIEWVDPRGAKYPKYWLVVYAYEEATLEYPSEI